MTSREQVLAAINHKQPDQIPVDLGGHPSGGISAACYNSLKKALGFEGGHCRVRKRSTQ